LLLSGDFQLKVADFNLSQYILSQDDSGLQREHLSTSSYLAPEVFKSNDYILQAVDLFSCGVILFLMVVGSPPFRQANLLDTHYKFIYKGQYSYFWKQIEKKIPI